jgi:hypothetical protein
VSIFGASAWNSGSPAYRSLFAAMRVRCQSSSVPAASLGPLPQELRMQRPDARDGEILSRALDQQGIDGSVSLQPIFAFDPIVKLNDKAREFR